MRKLYIDGKYVPSRSKNAIEVLNPATEEVLDRVPNAAPADVEAAVAAARRAQETWSETPGLERCDLLHHAARKMRDRRDALAKTLTLEGGKPFLENRDEIEWTAACLDYYAEIGRDLRGRVIAPVFRNQFNAVVYEPFGVVVAIVPWNYPLLLLSWKLAPALAAGNTLVIKPSEMTPLATLDVMECFSDFPKGVVNVVTGDGAVGAALVAHKDTDLIAVTGSIETGRRILIAAAERIKKVNLELGGSDPMIVCDDVDVEIAARGTVWSSFLNMGQVCTSTERIYVFENVYEKFVQSFVKHVKKLRIGSPMGPNVDLGPMISARERDKIEGKLAHAVKQGARVLAGGKRPKHLKKGFYFEPTVLADVNHDMDIMREETFGPIAPIMPVKNLDQAIRLANDTDCGLGACIFTSSLERAMTAATKVRSGSFWINDPLTDNDAGPFGGMKMTGHGRELGTEGLMAFMEIKHIHMDYKPTAKNYWFPYDWSHGRKTE